MAKKQTPEVEKEWAFADKELPKAKRARASEYLNIVKAALENTIFQRKGRVLLDFPEKRQTTVYSGLMNAIKDLGLQDSIYIKQRKDEGVWLVNPNLIPREKRGIS